MSTERKPDAATGPLYPYRKPRLSLTEPLRLIVLGATGSIGVQTLDLVRRHPARRHAGDRASHRGDARRSRRP